MAVGTLAPARSIRRRGNGEIGSGRPNFGAGFWHRARNGIAPGATSLVRGERLRKASYYRLEGHPLPVPSDSARLQITDSKVTLTLFRLLT
jgi:hypothetical protein